VSAKPSQWFVSSVLLALAFPILFIGLAMIVWPILDMMPFPGSTHSAFFEWWVPGIPLSWLGSRLLRRGLHRRDSNDLSS
jgi:hypothetical protein